MTTIGRRRPTELNTSSMADIAFLMLTFFLMTTVISNDKGLSMTLPEWRDNYFDHPIKERNVFSIRLNSADRLLVEGELLPSANGLRDDVKGFLLNNGAYPHLSESPMVAVVSLKTDRGTSHQAFMAVLDEVQAAYYEIYASRLGISAEEYRMLSASPISKKAATAISYAREGIPMNISIAEPTRLENQ